MNTKEVSERYGLSFALCSRWAKNNGVARVPVKGIMAYDWTEEDCLRFENRETRPGKKGGGTKNK